MLHRGLYERPMIEMQPYSCLAVTDAFNNFNKKEYSSETNKLSIHDSTLDTILYSAKANNAKQGIKIMKKTQKELIYHGIVLRH